MGLVGYIDMGLDDYSLRLGFYRRVLALTVALAATHDGGSIRRYLDIHNTGSQGAKTRVKQTIVPTSAAEELSQF